MFAASLLGFLASALLGQATAEDRFPPVRVSDDTVRYAITGQSPHAINAQLRQYALAMGHPEQGLTRSVIDIYATLEPGTGACRMTALEVGLHVTTTLPEWAPRWRMKAGLRKHVSASFARLERHEGGHRENALAAADALRTAVLALEPAPSCPKLQAAIDLQLQKAQWRLEAQDERYDMRTRYDERDDPRWLQRALASTPARAGR